ncbi:MAG: MlaD family protein [Chthoniobacterales bacterium]
MDFSNFSTQLRAGIFFLIGLICIGCLVIYFGRFSQWTGNHYTVTVEYANASGLLKGADVLLAGARIGEVEKPPVVLPSMRGVAVELSIDNRVKIPKKTLFSIGSSGLLGDRFVTVTLNDDADINDVLQPDSVVQGQRESNLADLEQQIGEILPKVNQVIGHINTITERLKSDIFSKQGMADLQESLANIHQTTDAFSSSSKQLQSVMQQASVFMNNGNKTMDSAKGAAEDLQLFFKNLRRHGVIFYRDTAKKK